MDSKPAMNPETAKALYEGLAIELANRLHAGHCDKCERGAASVPELELIRKFLADNGITEYARAGTPIRKILEKPPFPLRDPEAKLHAV